MKLVFVMSMVFFQTSCNTKPYKNLNLPFDSTKPLKLTKPKVNDKRKLDGQWVNLFDSIPLAKFDIRYATNHNFTGKKMYPCDACFMRPEAAKSLKFISDDARRMGLSLLIFDCYRPLVVQKILWKIKPDAAYVTPPNLGSQHNRGLAIDLTLLDSNGLELDMGSPFDEFSIKSHWNYNGLSNKNMENRALLKKLMKNHGFDTINSEWWHYHYKLKSYPIENKIWDCN